uniref:ANK_REP_REGION domain-containing protein n=1 Tax=Panagrellus redivivus TaxID=6233 RepID=A0A7E4ZWH3_PANRE
MSHKMETQWDAKLHNAAKDGDLYELQRILDSGRVHVDCADEIGVTALMRTAAGGFDDACIQGRMQVSPAGVAHGGTKVNLQPLHGNPQPLQGCQWLRRNQMQPPAYGPACILLIDEGADVNAATKPDGATALMFAAQGGYVEVVETLLKEGAKPSAKTKDGTTALLNASQAGHALICQRLLASGADPTHESLSDGANPIFLAAQNGFPEVLSVFAESGYPLNDAKRTSDGASPVWIASQVGQTETVEFLMEHGCRDVPRNDGSTGLFKAAQKGYEEIAQALVWHDSDLGLLGNGESALHAAALFGNTSIAKRLVEAGANPRLPNRHGETPIDLAQQMNYTDVVSLLRKWI